MIKLLFILIVSINMAFAQNRFGEEDKAVFLKEVKQEIAEGKNQNEGIITFEMIRPEFFSELEKYVLQKKLLRSEVNEIKNSYNDLTKKNVPLKQVETEFLNFLEVHLGKLAQSLPEAKDNEVCNELQCSQGLTCAPEPKASQILSKKKAGDKCQQDSDCSSNECLDDGSRKNIKVCEDVYRCYRPLNLGESCHSNPICGAGSCLEFDSMTSGIGECLPKKTTCSSSNECCSGLCSNNKCVENKICKSCAPQGVKPKQLEKCCEGLYLNRNGICVPDVPPSVIIEVRNRLQRPLEMIASLFVAEVMADETIKFQNALLKERIKENEQSTAEPYKDFGSANDMDGDLVREKFSFKNGSNFKTCEINLKNDYLIGLTKSGAIDLEMAMLAYSFVYSTKIDASKVTNDYWRINPATDTTSINARSIAISKKIEEKRARLSKIFDERSRVIACKCLDSTGYLNIEQEERKQFFVEKCEEYKTKYADAAKDADGKKYLDENLNGDASGIKGKTLIKEWLALLTETYMDLSTITLESSKDFNKLNDWISKKNWNETRYKNTDLFKFHIQSSSASMIGMGVLAGALLAAGVIGIVSGFSIPSFLSVWAIAGLITSSAVGGIGMWTAASLKGAWSSLRPKISDYEISPRSVSCGKKSTCQEYTRTLMQPYNDVCSAHISSNACIKNFMSISDSNQSIRYIIDPVIPFDYAQNFSKSIYKGDLAKDLDKGYYRALKEMKALDPKTYAGGKSGGQYVSESYLTDVFIDMKIAGSYLPPQENANAIDILSPEFYSAFSKAAAGYAIEQKIIDSSDAANLEVFAQTAYYYHFIWPKISKIEEISYPTVGMVAYYNLMTNDISSNLSASFAQEAKALNDLYGKHLDDLEKTKKIYSKGPSIEGIESKTELDRQSAISKVINGSGKLTDIDTSKLTDSQKGFVTTLQNLRDLRADQLKNLNQYQQQMQANGQGERMDRIAGISDAFKSEFTSGNNNKAKSLSGSLKDRNKSKKIANTNLQNAKSNFFDKNENTQSSTLSKNKNGLNRGGISGSGLNGSAVLGALDEKGEDQKNANGKASTKDGNANSNYNNYGMSGSEAYGGTGSSTGNSSGYGNNNQGNNGSSRSMMEDQKSLEEAINARDRSGKSKYASNDENTIFEIITNAYIRNYDKVLIKRKNKDTIEDR